MAATAPRGLLLITLTILLVALGCQSGTGDGGVSWTIVLDPQPPVVGTAALEASLFDAAGAAVTGAEIEVEANMHHAGMTPSYATLREAKAGRYTGTVDFTMAGDWFLLLEARLPDDRRVERTLDVRGVQPAP